jgi:hypothetical protein
MDYVYAMAGALQRKEKVGDGDCVVLVQHYAKAPHTSQWKQGRAVLDGLLASWHSGNRLLRHRSVETKTGTWCQALYFFQLHQRQAKKQNADGTWPNASDNAQAFSVIE